MQRSVNPNFYATPRGRAIAAQSRGNAYASVVVCPVCESQLRQPCTFETGYPRRAPHRERFLAAKELRELEARTALDEQVREAAARGQRVLMSWGLA